MEEEGCIWGSLEAHCWSAGFCYKDYEMFWERENRPKHKKLSEPAYLKLIEALDLDLEEYHKENP